MPIALSHEQDVRKYAALRSISARLRSGDIGQMTHVNDGDGDEHDKQGRHVLLAGCVV